MHFKPHIITISRATSAVQRSAGNEKKKMWVELLKDTVLIHAAYVNRYSQGGQWFLLHHIPIELHSLHSVQTPQSDV